MKKEGYIGKFNAEEKGSFLLWLTSPFIYSMVLPIAVLHVWTIVYEAICFPVYGIKKIDRRKYIRDQRWKLQYLNGLEKLNCLYCGYSNGVLEYVKAVANATEKNWCPIKDKLKKGKGDLKHRKNFAAYNSEKELAEYFDKKRTK